MATVHNAPTVVLLALPGTNDRNGLYSVDGPHLDGPGDLL